jgi:hypothetical protein
MPSTPFPTGLSDARPSHAEIVAHQVPNRDLFYSHGGLPPPDLADKLARQ